MDLAQAQLPAKSNVSMRHIYLYTHLLIAEANKAGRRVRIIWGNIKTASIGPDHQESGGLLLTLPQTAAMGTDEDLELWACPVTTDAKKRYLHRYLGGCHVPNHSPQLHR